MDKDPNELLMGREIAPLFGMKIFKEGAFKRLGIPITKTIDKPKGEGRTEYIRFAKRHDVEAAHARWLARQEQAKQPRPPRPASRAPQPVDTLLEVTTTLTESIGRLVGRIDALDRRVQHLTDMWEPPTTTAAPINGLAHS